MLNNPIKPIVSNTATTGNFNLYPNAFFGFHVTKHQTACFSVRPWSLGIELGHHLSWPSQLFSGHTWPLLFSKGGHGQGFRCPLNCSMLGAFSLTCNQANYILKIAFEIPDQTPCIMLKLKIKQLLSRHQVSVTMPRNAWTTSQRGTLSGGGFPGIFPNGDTSKVCC